MNEIIKVNQETMTVSARDLHDALEVQKRFSAWFETNSQGFVYGEDFTSVPTSTVVNNGAVRELEDYQCSVDMAKHICLMSRTDKGKQCRQYLIDLEKAWNTPEQVMARALKIANDTIARLSETARFMSQQIEEKTALIETMEPKVSYYDLVLQSDGLMTTTEISKDYGMSAKKFNKILHNYGIQYKQSDRWFLYAKYEGEGYTSSRTYPITKSNGDSDARTHMYWTQKGRLFLYDFLKSNGILPMIEQKTA